MGEGRLTGTSLLLLNWFASSWRLAQGRREAEPGTRNRLATTINGSTAGATEECWESTSFTDTLADPVLIPSSNTLWPWKPWASNCSRMGTVL